MTKAFSCREDKIRTCDPLNPIQVRYRAAPLPEQNRLNKPVRKTAKIMQFLFSDILKTGNI